MIKAIRVSDKKEVLASDVDKDADFYQCPNPDCARRVELKKGLKRIHHFYHPQKSNCEYKGESLLHRRIKCDIYNYLNSNHLFKEIHLEKWIYKPFVARPDIYIRTIKGNQIAIEVQAGDLTVEEVIMRTEKYYNLNIYVLWVLPYEEPRIPLFDESSPIASRRKVKLKEYETLLYFMYFKTLTFWDINHTNSDSFIILTLAKAMTGGGEFYRDGMLEFFDPRIAKTLKYPESIKLNVNLKEFITRRAQSFNIHGKTYNLPKRSILLYPPEHFA